MKRFISYILFIFLSIVFVVCVLIVCKQRLSLFLWCIYYMLYNVVFIVIDCVWYVCCDIVYTFSKYKSYLSSRYTNLVLAIPYSLFVIKLDDSLFFWLLSLLPYSILKIYIYMNNNENDKVC